jgi:hypothetical protein
MEIIGLILGFMILSLIVGTSLWVGLKITKVEGTFLGMIIIAAVTMLVGLIPGIGWILSLVALYFMLHKWTTAEFWPDAVILVAVAWAVRFAAVWILALLFLKLGMVGAGT